MEACRWPMRRSGRRCAARRSRLRKLAPPWAGPLIANVAATVCLSLSGSSAMSETAAAPPSSLRDRQLFLYGLTMKELRHLASALPDSHASKASSNGSLSLMSRSLWIPRWLRASCANVRLVRLSLCTWNARPQPRSALASTPTGFGWTPPCAPRLLINGPHESAGRCLLSALREADASWPPCVSEDVKPDIARIWRRLMSTAHLSFLVCACCARRLRDCVLRPASAFPHLSLLRKTERHHHVVPTCIWHPSLEGLILNIKGVSVSPTGVPSVSPCLYCVRKLRKNQLPSVATANMWFVGEVPDVLRKDRLRKGKDQSW